LATLVFLLASMTDLLDGFVARKFGLITTLGKVADPIADKFLTGVALLGLSYLGALPWWVTIVIIAREICVTLLRFWVIEHGVISASRGGKTRHCFKLWQLACISTYGQRALRSHSLTSGILQNFSHDARRGPHHDHGDCLYSKGTTTAPANRWCPIVIALAGG